MILQVFADAVEGVDDRNAVFTQNFGIADA